MSRKYRGLCDCGRPCRSKGRNPKGEKLWDRFCGACFESQYHYRRYKTDICAQCGFKAINKCQMDVDHIDGNSKNNDITNLQTLCANCHRLKTHKQQDHLKWDKTRRKIHVSLA